ncbi:MAG: hypothetical protein Q8O67_34025 [Deltaproteobacteria bacterium]|nr:hypothetical protein [Deltaproteobacteria bacterium]
MDDPVFLEWFLAQQRHPAHGHLIVALKAMTTNDKDLIAAALQESEDTPDCTEVRLCCHFLVRTDLDEKTRRAALDRVRDMLLTLRVLRDEPASPCKDELIVFWEWYGDVQDSYRQDKLMAVEDIRLPVQKLIGRTLWETADTVFEQIDVYLVLLLRRDVATTVKQQCIHSICKLTGGDRGDWITALRPDRMTRWQLRK